MRRKDLEITLSANVEGFKTPRIEFEQYSTPSRVAANLIHIAHHHKNIENKSVIDLCAGTGVLGIAASLMGAKVTSVEIDPDAIEILKSNYAKLDLETEIICDDVLALKMKQKFDTAVVNSPFGINRASKFKDMDFVTSAAELAEVVYSIHDGSETNREKLPAIFLKKGLKILEMYVDEFSLPKSYHFHKLKNKMYRVLVIRSERA